MRILIALCLALWGTTIKAEEPNTIRDNYPLVIDSPCSDSESGQSGRCYMFDRGDGTFYTVFTQHGEPVFVRQTLKEGGYITVWRFGEIEAWTTAALSLGRFSYGTISAQASRLL